MLTNDMRMISVDDHLVEHPTVWQDRLPSRFREAGPHIVEMEDGSELWMYEGEIVVSSGLGHSAGREPSQRHEAPQRFDQMRPGYYDPTARLKDMDIDGVAMQLCFPNWARYAGTRFYWGQDKELSLLCVQAYNDFVLDEWCAAAPHRYIPLILIPLWDAALCVSEIERCVPKGAKAIAFPENPAPLGLPSFHTDHWDGVFSAAEQAALPLCSHFGTSGSNPPVADDAPTAVVTACMGVGMHNDMADLVLSRTFQKHPDLKVVYSESGIGWWPNAMQRLDQVWETFRFHPTDRRLDPDARPSDIIRKHLWACFIDDPLGVELRHKIGVENLLWESDYPHADSLWPNSRRNASEVMSDVPDDEVRMIVETNARALFGLECEQSNTVQTSRVDSHQGGADARDIAGPSTKER